MPADEVKRSRIELRHDEVAPLVEPHPADRVARHVHARRRLECFAQVLDDRRALGDDHVAVPQHRNFMPRIDLEELGLQRLAAARMHREVLVVESHLGEHPVRPQLPHRAHAPEREPVRRHQNFSQYGRTSTSSDQALRCCGCSWKYVSAIASGLSSPSGGRSLMRSPKRWWIAGMSIAPSTITVATWIPCGPNSRAIDWATARNPNFVAAN